jgi:hypothetical protein
MKWAQTDSLSCGAAAAMTIESDYHGYRIEVVAFQVEGAWDAEVTDPPPVVHLMRISFRADAADSPGRCHLEASLE